MDKHFIIYRFFIVPNAKSSMFVPYFIIFVGQYYALRLTNLYRKYVFLSNLLYDIHFIIYCFFIVRNAKSSMFLLYFCVTLFSKLFFHNFCSSTWYPELHICIANVYLYQTFVYDIHFIIYRLFIIPNAKLSMSLPYFRYVLFIQDLFHNLCSSIWYPESYKFVSQMCLYIDFFSNIVLT